MSDKTERIDMVFNETLSGPVVVDSEIVTSEQVTTYNPKARSLRITPIHMRASIIYKPSLFRRAETAVFDVENLYDNILVLRKQKSQFLRIDRGKDVGVIVRCEGRWENTFRATVKECSDEAVVLNTDYMPIELWESIIACFIERKMNLLSHF